MKQRTQTYLLVTIFVSLSILISVCITHYLESELSYFYQAVSILFLLLLLLIAFLHGRKKIYAGTPKLEDKQSFSSWLIKCLLTQALTFLFFFSALSPLTHYAKLVPTPQTALSANALYLMLKHLFFDAGLFAYAFIILFALCLSQLSKRFTNKNSPLTHFPSLKNSVTKKACLTLYNSFRFGLILIAASTMSFFIIELNNNMFHTHSASTNTLVASLASGFFLITTLNNHVMKFITKQNKASNGLSISLIAFIVIAILIWLAASFINTYFHQKVSPYAHTLILTESWLPISLQQFTHIYAISWWVILTPLLGSIIYKLSAHRSYQQVIVFNLILPIIVCASFPLWGLSLCRYLTQHFIVPQILQGILILILLIFAQKRLAQQTFWLGYIPTTNIKSHLESEQIWLFAFISMGIYTLRAYYLYNIVLTGLSLYLFIALTLMLRGFIRTQKNQ